jgi:hypothetical protein
MVKFGAVVFIILPESFCQPYPGIFLSNSVTIRFADPAQWFVGITSRTRSAGAFVFAARLRADKVLI